MYKNPIGAPWGRFTSIPVEGGPLEYIEVRIRITGHFTPGRVGQGPGSPGTVVVVVKEGRASCCSFTHRRQVAAVQTGGGGLALSQC